MGKFSDGDCSLKFPPVSSGYFGSLLSNVRFLSTAVTTVDSGSKALEFLGLHEDDQSSSDSPSISTNKHHQACVLWRSSVAPEFCPAFTFFFCGLWFWPRSCFFCFSLFLQELEVNLIITDYCMPGMTGYDLLKKIKVQIFFPSTHLHHFPFVESFGLPTIGETFRLIFYTDSTFQNWYWLGKVAYF